MIEFSITIDDKEARDFIKKLSDAERTFDGEVVPQNADSLFIPQTRKGQNRGEGYKKDMKFGVDFVLVKKARAYKGTKFIDNTVNKIAENLERAIADKIDKL